MPNYYSIVTDGSMSVGGSILCDSIETRSKPMKEGKKELFKIVLNKTTVREYVFEVVAEDEATAKEMIEKGNARCEKETTLLEEVVEIKQ